MSSLKDEQNTQIGKLVSDYLKGDNRAFDSIVSLYLPSVYAFLFRFIGNRQDAEDISQESFIKAWDNIRRFKKGSSFKAWILEIARNSAIDLMRKRKDPSFSDIETGTDSFAEIIISDSPLPDELFSKSEDKARFDKLIMKLPLIYREIIALHYGEELSLQEISVLIAKPLNTVKSRNQRAIKMLAKELKNQIE